MGDRTPKDSGGIQASCLFEQFSYQICVLFNMRVARLPGEMFSPPDRDCFAG